MRVRITFEVGHLSDQGRFLAVGLDGDTAGSHERETITVDTAAPARGRIGVFVHNQPWAEGSLPAQTGSAAGIWVPFQVEVLADATATPRHVQSEPTRGAQPTYRTKQRRGANQ